VEKFEFVVLFTSTPPPTPRTHTPPPAGQAHPPGSATNTTLLAQKRRVDAADLALMEAAAAAGKAAKFH
jgi:hypothetical protein